ncbi:WD repeat-containing and planar cell polarity effector protein fritz [Bacillus rossius redtenbacheri]|uniref:WD repeat-containing and planar cell polarity effector protein fritz n=1 Tax=Bacillus rossius redtenbacheri TaxID=93214 RepID=UPI002FDD875B
MITLLSQAQFWTLKDEVVIKDSDFGAFRYHEKKDACDSPYSESKKTYAEKRGLSWFLPNKRPDKLRDAVKELEEQLSQHKVVFCQWRDSCILQIILSSGLLVNICVDVFTGDLARVSFDKYLVGKLLSECISDVILTQSHVIVSYKDNQMTVVHLARAGLRRGAPEKLGRLEPRLQVLELAGPAGRRLERRLSSSLSGDMVLVWWRCARDEVYPWSPVVKDQDRANVHVYSVSGARAELACYYRTEFDPVCVSFSRVQPSVIHSIEQKVSRKGEVTVESCTYEVSKSRLQRTAVTSIPLQTQVCCHGYSPDEEKLLLGCIDGSLVLFDEGRGITHLVKAAFISTMVSWHPDGALVLVANDRSQLQCFDVALACVRQQLLSEDVTPAGLLDLGCYFRGRPSLLGARWGPSARADRHGDALAPGDALLLLLFHRGPLAVLRLVGGGGLRGDAHGAGLTADALVCLYLSVNHVDRAVNVLLSLNWDSHGPSCLACLQRIVSHLCRQPLAPDREVQLQTALGSFHVPLQPMCHATELEFGEQVRDLTRRFFHHLLRYRMFDKAFRLAIDLNDQDLFMDIHHYARAVDERPLADAAREKAEQIFDQCSSATSSDAGSHSACSGCSGDRSWGEPPGARPRGSAPPLPVLRPGDRQRVQFSDTVTHILVPDELPEPAEACREPDLVPDPQQELADSLPLCLGNKHYLRDFAPAPDQSEEEENGNSSIKVIHFGVV